MTRAARRSVALACALAALSAGGHARADDDPCLTAPVEGQRLQKEGRLLEARARFAVCARQACPTLIIHDCGEWLRSATEALASVVVVARDAAGRDVVDATVAVDGRPAIAVPASAIELDPGPHTLVVARAGAPPVTERVFLREAEKERQVHVTFAGARAPADAPKLVERPVPALAWILGGVATAALGTGAAFGAVGLAQRSADACDTGCTRGQRDAIAAKFQVADVALGVGVVALGAAAWVFFTRPRVERARAVSRDEPRARPFAMRPADVCVVR